MSSQRQGTTDQIAACWRLAPVPRSKVKNKPTAGHGIGRLVRREGNFGIYCIET